MIYKVFLNLAKKNLNIRQIFICFPNLNSFPCMAFHSSSVKSWFFFDIGEKRKIKKTRKLRGTRGYLDPFQRVTSKRAITEWNVPVRYFVRIDLYTAWKGHGSRGMHSSWFIRSWWILWWRGREGVRRRLCRKIVPFRSFPCYLVNVGPMCTFQGLEHADRIIYFESFVRIFIFESGIFGGKRKR